jgi:Initiator Replication protein
MSTSHPSKPKVALKKVDPPIQISFWETDEIGVANTIALWDVAPRFVPRVTPDLKDGKYLKTLVRTFELGGRLYQATTKPVRIRGADGKEQERYPTDRERLVEWVIRRIASKRSRLSLDNKEEALVELTIYEIRKELERSGHTLSHAEITESIKILHESIVEIVRLDTDTQGIVVERVISASAFVQVAHANRRSESAKTTLQFNWLVSEALMRLDFRQMNYDQIMEMPGPIERWVYLRLNHDVIYYRMNPRIHELKATEIIEGAGLSNRKRKSMGLRRISEAVERLKKTGVIADYEAVDITQGKSLSDIHYTFTVTDRFVEDASWSLRRAMDMRADFKEVADSEPVKFIPADHVVREKLRRVRSKRRSEASVSGSDPTKAPKFSI